MDLHDNQRKTPVIIIDEGHLLGKEMLEEIRFLTNFRMDSYSPMSLILLGQPELRRILQMQIYEAITQRVNLRFHLSGMELEETRIILKSPACKTPCLRKMRSKSFMSIAAGSPAKSTMYVPLVFSTPLPGEKAWWMIIWSGWY